MSVSYEGKSPGKLWYFYQKTKGIFATKQQKPLLKSSAGTGISGASTYLITQQIGFVLAYLPIATAGLAGMAGYNAYRAVRPSDSDRKNRTSTQDRWVSAAKYGGAAAAVFILTPMLTTWVSVGAMAATGYFAFRGYKNWKEGAKSMPVRNFIRDQEAKWVEHKKNGTLKKRLGRALNAVKSAIRNTALRTGKYGGFAAAAGGLVVGGIAAAQAAGAAIVPAGIASSVVGTLTAAAATVGIGAAAAVYGAAALVALAVPVGIVAGLVCRNKLREAAPANDDSGKRKPFYQGLSEDITADVRAPVQKQQPANGNTLGEKTAAATFNTEAEKPAPAKPAPKPAPQPAADPEAEAMRKRAAEERARARRKR
ncbi:MAG: hypothetical protein Q8K65_04055 [Alphaproteobacteria bacterium]|nr:hypothetical protein [Alphaproteobacteria bacterium]